MIFDHEWLNRNSLRSYPLADGAGGGMPHALLSDVFAAGSFDGGAFLLSARISARSATVVIGDLSGAAMGYAVAEFGMDRYPVAEISQIPGGAPVSGRVVFGPIFDPGERADLSEFLGAFDFGAGEAPLCPRCYIDCGLPPLSSIRCGMKSGSASGAISIDPGPGISLSVSESTHASGEKIYTVTVGLQSPPDLLNPCSPRTSDPRGACGEGAIRSINGVSRHPDTKGIEIEFAPQPTAPRGSVVVDTDRNTVEIEYLESAQDSCIEDPALPDQYGRMPDSFDGDCPPKTPYGSDPGPPCLSPDAEGYD